MEAERDALKEERDELNTRLDGLSDRIDAAEREKVRDNPELVKLYQMKRDIEKQGRDQKTKEADLNRHESQFTADKNAFETDMRKWAISGIASKYGLKTEELEDLGISDMTKLEKVAQRLSTAKPPEAKRSEEKSFEPDSGETSGGAGELTSETRETMSMEKLAEHPSIKQRFPRKVS